VRVRGSAPGADSPDTAIRDAITITRTHKKLIQNKVTKEEKKASFLCTQSLTVPSVDMEYLLGKMAHYRLGIGRSKRPNGRTMARGLMVTRQRRARERPGGREQGTGINCAPARSRPDLGLGARTSILCPVLINGARCACSTRSYVPIMYAYRRSNITWSKIDTVQESDQSHAMAAINVIPLSTVLPYPWPLVFHPVTSAAYIVVITCQEVASGTGTQGTLLLWMISAAAEDDHSLGL
jgi:hypothetical protein